MLLLCTVEVDSAQCLSGWEETILICLCTLPPFSIPVCKDGRGYHQALTRRGEISKKKIPVYFSLPAFGASLKHAFNFTWSPLPTWIVSHPRSAPEMLRGWTRAWSMLVKNHAAAQFRYKEIVFGFSLGGCKSFILSPNRYFFMFLLCIRYCCKAWVLSAHVRHCGIPWGQNRGRRTRQIVSTLCLS